MIVKQVYKKKKEPTFQNTGTSVENEQNQSEKIDDIKLDSAYVNNTEESETKDDDGSITSKNDSDEK